MYAQTANIDYIEHLDPDNVEDEVLNPFNMNFEELSFENLISVSQFEAVTNIEQLLIGKKSSSSAGTSASFFDSSTTPDINLE